MPTGVYTRTEETRKILSLAKKGKTRPALNQETKDKIANTLRGKKHTEERRRNESIAHKGQRKGELNHNWNGGSSTERAKIQLSLDYRLWRERVFNRDDFTCQICNSRGVKLHAHHIKSFAKYAELRFDVNNGKTLCKVCHMSLYGLLRRKK